MVRPSCPLPMATSNHPHTRPRVVKTWRLLEADHTTTEYYTEVHLHCFLRKLYSSWFVTQQVP
jgi:hypothetical protein